ncbi:MAG: hypothetical protein E6X35_06990 [Enterococcus gallinarum]|nr:hypothetical protein [Enterococcus gallinarum]MDU4931999.1 hypothetical protein [Enterococcus gallinarum]
MTGVKADTIGKKQSLIIGGTPMIVSQALEPTIIIGKYKVDVQTLEKLIEFAQSGKLDEIMPSED